MANTDLSTSIIPPPSAVQTDDQLKSFSDVEVEHWKAGVRNNDWESLIAHPKFRAETTSASTSGVSGIYARIQPTANEELATEISWGDTYVGDADLALWAHIKEFPTVGKEVYAYYAAIVQSSGMGKSRTVDELAKTHFVIPINLRDAASSGFPPADDELRNFLTRESTRVKSYDQACAFLEALFQHTATMLRQLHPQPQSVAEAAQRFRKLMTEGQKMLTGHNPYRRGFYKQVVRHAGELLKKSVRNKPVGFPPADAFATLAKVLKGFSEDMPGPPSPTETQRTSPRKQPSKSTHEPLVIFACDEAHTLAKLHHAGSREWSKFTQLQLALRALHNRALFSLFLSTAGKISQSTSAMTDDVSARIIQGLLNLIQPFTDLGFDQLAKKVSVDGSWNLKMLTQDSHIVSLGRPMFGSRYQTGDDDVKARIIAFAASKLLNQHHSFVDAHITKEQALACLSQRFPIEFDSTTYTAQADARKQVGGHLRVCVNIDADSENMTTVSASEPLLSEAAYFIMKKPSFDAPRAFQTVLNRFAISKGDRGEFLVMLFYTLARDMTVGGCLTDGRPKNHRWFKLSSFLCKYLFRLKSSTITAIDQQSLQSFKRLSQDFSQAQLHFNHIIKLHEDRCIDLESLLLLHSRGAGVLCAAVDGIFTFAKNGGVLAPDNAGLILWQSKLDTRFTDTPRQSLFDAMDPYTLGILQESDAAIPPIKIVFALAAKKPALKAVRRAATQEYNAIVYEIWCAGISPDILGPIEKEKAGVWDALLRASYGWKDLYKKASSEARGSEEICQCRCCE